MIYSKNLNVAKTAAKQISEKRIIRFKTQNALYIFMEDIKNPFLKNYRERNKMKTPAYTGYQNYDPSINYLIEKGILKRNRGSYRVVYEVNKENLSNFLQTK